LGRGMTEQGKEKKSKTKAVIQKKGGSKSCTSRFDCGMSGDRNTVMGKTKIGLAIIGGQHVWVEPETPALYKGKKDLSKNFPRQERKGI